LYTICLTFHYTYYLFYCERKQNIQTISLTLHYRYYLFLLCDKIQNNKNGISFLSLFIIQIIYSIVRERQPTLHYTYYLFYCVTKYKTTKMVYHFSHSSLYKLFILLCDKIQNNKNGISFLSLFIIQIIYSIVREIQEHTNIVLHCDKCPHNGATIVINVKPLDTQVISSFGGYAFLLSIISNG
jgi:hypothetical protein